MFQAVILLSTLFSVAFAQTHSGWATAYAAPYQMDSTGKNMCGFNPTSLADKWQQYFVAMNQADWNANGGMGICGQCIRITGTAGQVAPGFTIKPIIAKIVDQCPSWACSQGSVDLSTTALSAATGYSWDKKTVTWEFVDCSAPADPAAAAAAAAAAQAAAQAAAARAAAAAAAAKQAATIKAVDAAVQQKATLIQDEAGNALGNAALLAAAAGPALAQAFAPVPAPAAAPAQAPLASSLSQATTSTDQLVQTITQAGSAALNQATTAVVQG